MKNKFLAAFAAVALTLCLNSVAIATPYTGADIELKGIETSGRSDVIDSRPADWFDNGDSVWTAWANTWVEYTVDLTEGNWDIGLNVTNHGNLGTDWYSQFEVSNNLTNDKIIIVASSTEINSGSFNIDISEDDTFTIRYTWLNDKWAGADDTEKRDANIEIASAFFDNKATAPVPEPSTMLLFGAGLTGLVGFNRRRKK